MNVNRSCGTEMTRGHLSSLTRYVPLEVTDTMLPYRAPRIQRSIPGWSSIRFPIIASRSRLAMSLFTSGSSSRCPLLPTIPVYPRLSAVSMALRRRSETDGLLARIGDATMIYFSPKNRPKNLPARSARSMASSPNSTTPCMSSFKICLTGRRSSARRSAGRCASSSSRSER